MTPAAVVRVIGLFVLIIIGGLLAFQFRGQSTSKPTTIQEPGNLSPAAVRYLALGDSYTIGQSVGEADRWPNQLVARLAQNGTKLQIVANPSVTGYTTQNLIDRELPLVAKLKPDFVTILIGVNDYVQGVDATTFQKNLNYIIDTTQKELPKPGNILLVTIPDYGKTPTGAEYGAPSVSEQGIEQFNQIIVNSAKAHDLPVADIFPVSQQVASDPSLIADDGLHPSGKEYTDWTNVIYATLEQSNISLK